jgi:hypothetical protein
MAKFAWGGAVSNFPGWQWHSAGGVGLAALIFAAALAACWLYPPPPVRIWLAIAANAFASGLLIGWTVRNVPIESLTAGDWVRSFAWVAVAISAPVAGAMALATGTSVPSLARMFGRRSGIPREPLAFVLGALLIVLVVLAVQAALGLVFNPRYRDFPFTALTAAAIPFLVMRTSWPRRRDLRPSAETVAAGALALCAIVIAANETPANWQAMWFCAGLVALAVSLLPARDAPG